MIERSVVHIGILNLCSMVTSYSITVCCNCNFSVNETPLKHAVKIWIKQVYLSIHQVSTCCISYSEFEDGVRLRSWYFVSGKSPVTYAEGSSVRYTKVAPEQTS